MSGGNPARVGLGGAAIADALQTRGHDVELCERGDLEFGGAQFVHALEHGYVAASDHRRDGIPMGF